MRWGPPDTVLIVSVLVAGATGYTGSAVVKELRRRGEDVVAHIRPESSARAQTQRELDAVGAHLALCRWQPQALTAMLHEHQPRIVFSLIGTTADRARDEGIDAAQRFQAVDQRLTAMLLEAAAGASSIKRFVLLSAVGSSPSSGSAYLRTRAAMEQTTTASGLCYTIARPSFITGSRKKTRLGESVGASLANGALTLAGLLGACALRERYRSIDSVSLARALVSAALDSRFANAVIEGPEIQQLAKVKRDG